MGWTKYVEVSTEYQLLHKDTYHKTTYFTLPSDIHIFGTTRQIQTGVGQPRTDLLIIQMEDTTEYAQFSKRFSTVSIDSNKGEVRTKKEQQ